MGLLLRTLYVSETNMPSGEALSQIRNIQRVAQERNGAGGITGMLLFSDRFFVQVLEGPRLAVTATLGRILTDERHDRIRLAQSIEIAQRAFGSWAMRLVDDRSHWTLPSSGRAFDPSEATADDLLQLLRRAGERAAA